jgi:hypothetical protein
MVAKVCVCHPVFFVASMVAEVCTERCFVASIILPDIVSRPHTLEPKRAIDHKCDEKHESCINAGQTHKFKVRHGPTIAMNHINKHIQG